jgi:hypothetical protein
MGSGGRLTASTEVLAGQTQRRFGRTNPKAFWQDKPKGILAEQTQRHFDRTNPKAF